MMRKPRERPHRGEAGRGIPATACAALLGWLLLACFLIGASRADSFSELEVRAVYLYNFAVFAQWPAAAFASPTSPIRYCVLGSRGLRASLANVLAEERIDNRPLELVGSEGAPNWRSCHVLYVDHSSSAVVSADALGSVRGAPVLTIGDSEDFARKGGMVALVRKGGRVQTVINRDAVEAAGIRISSKLLRMSKLVSGSASTNAP